MFSRRLFCILLLALTGCMERDKPDPLPRHLASEIAPKQQTLTAILNPKEKLAQGELPTSTE
jgi:hypothetical protein